MQESLHSDQIRLWSVLVQLVHVVNTLSLKWFVVFAVLSGALVTPSQLFIADNYLFAKSYRRSMLKAAAEGLLPMKLELKNQRKKK